MSAVAVLLVDHQSGLVNLVHDFSPDDFKNNVLALADAAAYFKLPTILTTSLLFRCFSDPSIKRVADLPIVWQ